MSNNTTISPSPNERAKILASIKKLVLKHHINVGGVSYDAWTTLVDQRTPELLAVETEQIRKRCQAASIGTRGAAIQPSITKQGNSFFLSIPLMRLFAAFTVAGSERWFFLDVFEGGPAHVAGIKPGDMLLAVNGTDYLPPTMPPFDVGQTVRFEDC